MFLPFKPDVHNSGLRSLVTFINLRDSDDWQYAGIKYGGVLL
jgi:hypothetical protein